jgi:TonB family protein
MFGNWHLKFVILCMKPILSLILSFFLFANSFSQTNNSNVPDLPAPMAERIELDSNIASDSINKIYESVDEPASFPGGMQALSKFIQSHFKYPEGAMEKGVQGTCYIRFVINDDGRVYDIKVFKGIIGGADCDIEALRIVRKMRNWLPARKNGKGVASYYQLPIKFVLAEDE